MALQYIDDKSLLLSKQLLFWLKQSGRLAEDH